MKFRKSEGRRSLSLQGALTALLAISLSLGGAVGISSAAESPKALETVTLATPVLAVPSLPLWVAQAKGFFAAHGLNVNIVVLTSSTLTPALTSGSVQFITDSTASFLISRATATPIVAVSEYNNNQINAFIVGTAWAAAHGITAKTPLATVMKDIPGSIGGSSSSPTTGSIEVLFRSYGIQTSQFSLASFASTPATVAALAKGSIDWLASSEPTPLQAQADGYGIIVATSKNAAAWRVKYLNQVLVTTNTYAANDPGITRAFVAAVDDGTAYVHAHGQQTVPIAAANLSGVSNAILSKAIQSIGWPTSGKMNANIWRSTIAFNVRAGNVAHGTAVTEGVDWTNKYVTH